MSRLELKYFVLKPRSKTRSDPYAKASRAAMVAYSRNIRQVDSRFADDLLFWVEREETMQENLSEEPE